MVCDPLSLPHALPFLSPGGPAPLRTLVREATAPRALDRQGLHAARVPAGVAGHAALELGDPLIQVVRRQRADVARENRAVPPDEERLGDAVEAVVDGDRTSTRLNSSH